MSTENAHSTVKWQIAPAAPEHDADHDPTVLALTLYRTMTAFDRAAAAELAPHGLTVSQFAILTVLHRAERPLTMGELGQAVAVRPANLTGVVDGLTRRSLVERQINPFDRRSYLITKTPAGDEFLAGFLPGHCQRLDRLMRGLTRDERAMLADLLERLRQSVTTVDQGPGVPPGEVRLPRPRASVPPGRAG
jgi:DNA-binding MarR family transcriptional regulator